MREILAKARGLGKFVQFGVLVFMAGWSLYQAFDCLMKARELRNGGDDRKDDPPPEAPEPPPDDGLHAQLDNSDGVIDLSREQVAKILAEKA